MTAGEGAAIRVLAAVIARGDHYLVCKRPAGKRHAGLWEFPGGKMLEGESLFDAAARELSEELGVGVTCVGEVLFSRRDEGSAYVIEFAPVEITGEPVALEHDSVLWAGVGEIRELGLAPADLSFFERHLDA